jgi:hypothetical protein
MRAECAAAQPEGLLSLIETIIRSNSSSCTAAAVLSRWPVLQQAISVHLLSHSSSTARQGASAVLHAVARCDSACVTHTTTIRNTADAPLTAAAITTDTTTSGTSAAVVTAFSFVVQVLQSLSSGWGDCSIDVSSINATTVCTSVNGNLVPTIVKSLPLPVAPQQSVATTIDYSSTSTSSAAVGAAPPIPPVHSSSCADSSHADSSTTAVAATAGTAGTTTAGIVGTTAVRSWQEWESVFMTYDAVLTDVLYEHLLSLQALASHTKSNSNSASSSSSGAVLSRLKAAGFTAVLAAVVSQLEAVLSNPLFEHQFELRRISVQVRILYRLATIACIRDT